MSSETAPEKPGAPTQTELMRKEVSVQVVTFNGCPDTSPEEKAGTYTKCARVDPHLWQVAE